MEKRINTLAELVNVFSNVSVEQFLDILLGYAADVKEQGAGRYPFPKTDEAWAQSLMDCYLQAVDTCNGDVDLCKAFRYEVNDYLVSCEKENREMYYLVADYRDDDAYCA
uniref:Uncharacterized protein n=1 Tax=uncultured Alphaproteobacteria bacterium TaxID=91750 RepID=A0A6G8F208_9PROT|nr:hypothetical protein PlAlph_1190 [uncultured Alphaproteobacteria bacterium]